jgi:hypothetical protein
MNEIQTKYIEEIQIKITEAFVKKYFNKDATYWWVNDEVGTVFFINDFWLDWEVILFCICNNISTKKFFQCYLRYEENIDITSQLESKPLIEFLK